MGSYASAFERSIGDPARFWAEAAREIHWMTPPERVLDDGAPPYYRWFTGGELNTCQNAVDRHIDAGRGDQLALIYDSPVTGTTRTYTYFELRAAAARCAGVLRSLGVERGDRVLLYLPMIPQAVIAMLGCARIGAVHSVVFGGFAARELALRIDDARPKVVIAASCGIEGARVVEYKPLLDDALKLAAHQVGHAVIVQRPEAPAALTAPRDLDWDERMAAAAPAPCVPVAATDPLYILYTSGTTGRPKGVVRDNGGHAVALRWSMPNIYGAGPGDVFWAASDVGWVVGHSYIVYAPLLTGCTTVLYEGKPVGTPDAGAFWRVAAEHRVKVMFTAPTAIRAIKREDPGGALAAGHDLSALEALYLAGERLDPDTCGWAARTIGRPVIDHWWQTETGWPISAIPRGLEPMPVKPGSAGVPMPGYDVAVVGPDGSRVPPGAHGDIVIGLPLPPGTLPTLWNDDERYVGSYLSRYQGRYLTGDGGRIDDDGYLWVMGRTDDVMNVAGHRLSTGGMEEVLTAHPAVAEAAVVGVRDDLKGQVPRGFVVLTSGADVDEDGLAAELVAAVRDQVGPVASFKQVTVVPALPKTRSGKILRATMRTMVEGGDVIVPSTIEDPAVLDRLGPILRPPG